MQEFKVGDKVVDLKGNVGIIESIDVDKYYIKFSFYPYWTIILSSTKLNEDCLFCNHPGYGIVQRYVDNKSEFLDGGCKHEFIKYNGFRFEYEYCKHCDIKRG